jgi:hypothetical protein
MINRPHTTHTNEEENVNATLHIPTMTMHAATAPWGAEKKKTGKPMQNVFEEPCYNKKIVT